MHLEYLKSKHFGLPIFGGFSPINSDVSEIKPENAFLVYPINIEMNGNLNLGFQFGLGKRDLERTEEEMNKLLEFDIDKIKKSNTKKLLYFMGVLFDNYEPHSLLVAFQRNKKVDLSSKRQKHFGNNTHYIFNHNLEKNLYEGEVIKTCFGEEINHGILLDFREEISPFFMNEAIWNEPFKKVKQLDGLIEKIASGDLKYSSIFEMYMDDALDHTF